MSETRWVVQTDGELFGVTSDLGKAEQVLREEYKKDNPDADLAEIGFDLKLGDWFLTCGAVRLRSYAALKTEEL